MTGGFGEQTCHLCHLDNPINAPGGAVALDGVPAAFTPGQTYPITVTISRQGLRRGGFEIAARFAGGRQKGRQAGSWRLLDARAQLIPGAVDKALTFVQHNQTGSRAPRPGANSWTMEWTAPSGGSGSGAVQRRRQRVEQRRLAAGRLHLCEGGQERCGEIGAGGLGLGARQIIRLRRET